MNTAAVVTGEWCGLLVLLSLFFECYVGVAQLVFQRPLYWEHWASREVPVHMDSPLLIAVCRYVCRAGHFQGSQQRSWLEFWLYLYVCFLYSSGYFTIFQLLPSNHLAALSASRRLRPLYHSSSEPSSFWHRPPGERPSDPLFPFHPALPATVSLCQMTYGLTLWCSPSLLFTICCYSLLWPVYCDILPRSSSSSTSPTSWHFSSLVLSVLDMPYVQTTKPFTKWRPMSTYVVCLTCQPEQIPLDIICFWIPGFGAKETAQSVRASHVSMRAWVRIHSTLIKSSS